MVSQTPIKLHFGLESKHTVF